MRFIDVLKTRTGRPLDFAEIETKTTSLAEDKRLLLVYLFGS